MDVNTLELVRLPQKLFPICIHTHLIQKLNEMIRNQPIKFSLIIGSLFYKWMRVFEFLFDYFSIVG